MSARATSAALAAIALAAIGDAGAGRRRHARSACSTPPTSRRTGSWSIATTTIPAIRCSRTINRDNVKDLKLKFIFSIGGRSTGGTLRGKEESTPLVDDGFMYVSDTWDRVMKFDVRSGTEAVPLWRYDPKITQSRTNRGIAMYGNKVFIATNDMRMIALNRDSGEVAWEVQARAPTDPATGTPSAKTQGFTAAPLTLKTRGGKELVAAGREHRRPARHPQLGRRLGRQYRPARLAHLHHPGAGRARLRDLEGQPQCLARRRRRRVADRVLRSGHQPASTTAPAMPSRASIPNSGRATTCSPPAPSRSMPTPARSSGTSRRHRTSIGTSTRRARRCSTRSPSTARPARSWRTSRATASTTRSIAPTGSSCGPTSTRRRSPGPRASIPKTGKPVDYDPQAQRAALCRRRRHARQARPGGLPLVERLADLLPADARSEAHDRLCGRRRGLLGRHQQSRPRWTRPRTMSACRRAAASRDASRPMARSGRSMCAPARWSQRRSSRPPASPAC